MSILWLYWENPADTRMPAYIALCRAIIEYKCHDMDIRVVTPDNVREYLPDFDRRIDEISLESDPAKLCIPIKVAFIRAFLLEKYGGVYLDSDCLPIKSMTTFQALCTFDRSFAAIRRVTAPKKHISIGLMASDPGGPVITQYAETLRKLLSGKTVFKWGEVGAFALTPIVNENLKSCAILSEEFAHPVVAEKQYLFMSKDLDVLDVVKTDAYTIMLFHRPFTGPSRAFPEFGLPATTNGWLREHTVEDLYYGEILLSKMIRSCFPEKKFNEMLPSIKELMGG